MTTLMQAVTRAREDNLIAPGGDVLVTQLQNQYQQPADRGSLRALIRAMMAQVAIPRPFAVILCRFKGDAPHPDEPKWEAFFRQAFTRGTGGFVEYWQDVSLGKIDVGNTKIFGWVEVDIARADAGFPPVRRGDLTNAAIRAVQAKGEDPFTGFYQRISCYLYGKTAAGQPIDGSADGLFGKINLGAPFDGQTTAHEMGHSLGMSHDGDVTGDTKYHDPACIMSEIGSFPVQPWGLYFGPAICLPHLALQGWMYNRRMLFDNGPWATHRDGITFKLAPNTEPASPAFLGASLSVPGSSPPWAYLLEVVKATDWNQGVAGMPYLMIRRTSSHTDLGPDITTCLYLHAIQFTQSGSETVYDEVSGRTTFTVSLTSARGPIVTVNIKKTQLKLGQTITQPFFPSQPIQP